MFGLFKPKTYENISAQEFQAGMAGKDSVILDVRTKGEFSEGYIPGAKLIDVTGPGFAEAVEKLDKSKTYYVYCRSGGRSGSACGLMGKMGFEKVYNLSGGMMGWNGPVKR